MGTDEEGSTPKSKKAKTDHQSAEPPSAPGIPELSAVTGLAELVGTFGAAQQQAALNFFNHAGAANVLVLLEADFLFNAFVETLGLQPVWARLVKERLEKLRARQ